jgi:hypothetical protein
VFAGVIGDSVLRTGLFQAKDLDNLHAWYEADAANVSTGGARQFTAANSEYLNNASTDLQTGNIDFAFSFWVFPDTDAAMGVVSKYTGTNSTSEYSIEITSGLNVKILMNAAGETPKTSVGALIEDAWNHVVVEHTASTNIKITINGGATETFAYTDGNTVGTVHFRVGSRNGSSVFMNGRLALLGFWKRVLTAAEITQLWNTGRGIAYGDMDSDLKTSLTGFWNLNEADGAAIDQHSSYDLSDNASVTAANGPGAGKARQYTKTGNEWHELDPSINPGTSDFAICGWVYLDDTSGNKQLISNGAGSNGQNGFSIYTNGGDVKMYFNDSVQGTRVSKTYTSGITATTWFFWLMNFDRDGNAELFVNNVSKGSLDISGHAGSLDPAEKLAIGGLYDSSLEEMNGRICRTMWFTGLLNSTARTALYNDGEGLAYADLTAHQKSDWNLYAAWDGDEISGNLLDQHGSNDMADIGTVTSAEGPEATVAKGIVDGDPVQNWTDKSSNRFEAVQATAVSKPVWKDAIINSKPVVRFDGSDDLMAADAIATALTGDDKPYTIALVTKQTGPLSGSDTFYSLGRSSTNVPFDELVANGTSQYETQRQDDYGSDDQETGGTPDTASHVLVVTFTGTAVSVHLDGTAIVDNQTHNVDEMTVDQFTLGALRTNANSNYLKGDIAELIVYSDAKSAADRGRLEQYLGNKYGITIA